MEGLTRQLPTPWAAPGARGHQTALRRRAPGNQQRCTSLRGAHQATLPHSPPARPLARPRARGRAPPPEQWPLTQAGAPVPRGLDNDKPPPNTQGNPTVVGALA